MRLEVIRVDENHFAGVFGPIVITYWCGRPSVEAIQLRRPWLERRLSKGLPFGQLTVVEKSASFLLPDLAFARESHAQLQIVQDCLGFGALVVEGDDVSRALIRSYTRNQVRDTSKNHQTKSFVAIDGAVSWLGEQFAPHGGPSSVAILEAAQTLRAMPAE